MTPEDFLRKFYNHALKSEETYGIPALFTLAQAALESGWGAKAPQNNFFGIKATVNWKGATQLLKTREVVKGKDIYIYATFRAYPTAYECFEDHAQFLLKNPRYKAAFEYRQDPYKFADEVAKAGYATDPQYAGKVKSIITLLQKILMKKDIEKQKEMNK